MVLNVHRNHKAYWGRGEVRGVWGGGEREVMYCVHDEFRLYIWPRTSSSLLFTFLCVLAFFQNANS